MKKLIYILIFCSLLVSCISKGIKESSQNLKDSILQTETVTNSISDSIAPKIFGQLILEEKVKPSDNQNTFNCLTKLIEQDQPELEFYFKVYRKIAENADGALSEIIGGYTKTFLELNPDFCLEKLNSFESKEKDLFVENIAFEFYASGVEFEPDINEYIVRAEKNLKNSSQSNLDSLSSIKRILIIKAKEMNE